MKNVSNVERVRRLIRNGTYQSPHKIRETADRVAAAMVSAPVYRSSARQPVATSARLASSAGGTVVPPPPDGAAIGAIGIVGDTCHTKRCRGIPRLRYCGRDLCAKCWEEQCNE